MVFPALELDHVSLRIGGARILNEVSFSVESGEMLGVIGPNGAGKTTLFNVISGIVPATAGAIKIGGTEVTNHSVHRRVAAGLGRTFQSSNLFDGLTVLENVRLASQVQLGRAASVMRFPHRDDQASETARRHLAEVGLDDKAAVLAGSLAHGDKRKLEVAMLVAGDPQVILLDEPMAGVGSGDISGLTETIRQLRGAGRTVLLVEHHMDVVLGLVDRVAVMDHGELLALGSPLEVMADPAVQAAYLGEPV